MGHPREIENTRGDTLLVLRYRALRRDPADWLEDQLFVRPPAEQAVVAHRRRAQAGKETTTGHNAVASRCVCWLPMYERNNIIVHELLQIPRSRSMYLAILPGTKKEGAGEQTLRQREHLNCLKIKNPLKYYFETMH